MTEIEKMQRYIKRTKLSPKAADKYYMTWADLIALHDKSRLDAFGALCLAFDYGRAKGYRTAKAEKGATA